MIVLDASAAVSWLLNEPNPAAQLGELMITQQVVVPAHWPAEVGNTVLKALRRKRISDEDIEGISIALNALDLAIEPPVNVLDVFALLRFAYQHGLTMYDAAYVRLAIDRQAALATLDIAMRQVAMKLGVELAL